MYILDIGTGTGILAIMVAQRFEKALIEGIDADRIAAEQAENNVRRCPWTDRIKIKAVRIQDYVKETGEEFDLILCNPPYHVAQQKSDDRRKNLAKHSTDLGLSELAFSVDRLISANGHFYAILPPAPFRRLEKELSICGIRNFDHLFVYNLPGKPLYRIIGGFS
jgi:tRNA1Val (adenine37-N6)-methyltransferase